MQHYTLANIIDYSERASRICRNLHPKILEYALHYGTSYKRIQHNSKLPEVIICLSFYDMSNNEKKSYKTLQLFFGYNFALTKKKSPSVRDEILGIILRCNERESRPYYLYRATIVDGKNSIPKSAQLAHVFITQNKQTQKIEFNFAYIKKGLT